MPSKTQIQLFKLSSIKVSEQIVNCCIQSHHCTQIVNLLHDRINGKWKAFSELLKEYNLSTYIENEILETSLKLWSQKKRDLSFTTEAAEISYILIHILCLSRTSQWKFELKKKQKKSVLFMTNFSPNLRELKVTCNPKGHTLENILTVMSRIVILDIGICDLPEQISAIGKACQNLQKLHICCVKTMSPDFACRLCFQDYPTNSVKNPICNSLRDIDALFTLESVVIILENIRNLRTLINEQFLDYHTLLFAAAAFHRQVFPCSLEYVRVKTYPRHLNFQDVFQRFPNLNSILVTCANLHAVLYNENIRSLIIESNQHLATVNQENLAVLLQAPWFNLRNLALVFQGHVINADLSIVSTNCPNLQTLHLRNCVQTTGIRLTPFRNLQKLIVETIEGTVDHVLMNQISETLVTLVFCCLSENPFDETSFAAAMSSNQYPVLKHFVHWPMFSTQQKILDVLDRLPVLKTYGLITDNELRHDLKQNCKERNWDLNILKRRGDVNVNLLF